MELLQGASGVQHRCCVQAQLLARRHQSSNQSQSQGQGLQLAGSKDQQPLQCPAAQPLLTVRAAVCHSAGGLSGLRAGPSLRVAAAAPRELQLTGCTPAQSWNWEAALPWRAPRRVPWRSLSWASQATQRVQAESCAIPGGRAAARKPPLPSWAAVLGGLQGWAGLPGLAARLSSAGACPGALCAGAQAAQRSCGAHGREPRASSPAAAQAACEASCAARCHSG